MFESSGNWRGMLARERAGTSVAGEESAVRAARGDKGLRGSVLWATMEVTAVGHALIELWIGNTGSSSQVFVVVVYATGGWTVLERVRLSCTPEHGPDTWLYQC